MGNTRPEIHILEHHGRNRILVVRSHTDANIKRSLDAYSRRASRKLQFLVRPRDPQIEVLSLFLDAQLRRTRYVRFNLARDRSLLVAEL